MDEESGVRLGLLAGAMEFLEGLFGKKAAPVQVLGDDGVNQHYLVRTQDGQGWREVSKKIREDDPRTEPQSLKHKLLSVDSFVAFCNGPLAKVTDGVVFVCDKEVVADLPYIERTTRQVKTARMLTLTLASSPEFAGLLALTQGVGQKDLWRLLVTVLHSSIEGSLALQISNIKVQQSSEAKVDIQSTGLTDASSTSRVLVSFNNAKGEPSNQVVNLDWEWTGRIWSCFENAYTVHLRLELDVRDGRTLVFRFYPVDLDDALQAARLDLVKKLTNDIQPERFTVYDGTFE